MENPGLGLLEFSLCWNWLSLLEFWEPCIFAFMVLFNFFSANEEILESYLLFGDLMQVEAEIIRIKTYLCMTSVLLVVITFKCFLQYSQCPLNCSSMELWLPENYSSSGKWHLNSLMLILGAYFACFWYVSYHVKIYCKLFNVDAVSK